MKLLSVLLACVLVATGKQIPIDPLETTAFDYARRFGIPLAEKIIAYEEQLQNDPSRVVGGAPASLGQFPYKTSVMITYAGVTGVGVCGGSLVTHRCVLTAAHCWNDGRNQGISTVNRFGSIWLTDGGHVEISSRVITHQQWNPTLIRNDIAVIMVETVAENMNNVISPVAVPYDFAEETFNGAICTVSGFGLKADGAGINQDQYKSYVHLSAISNTVCSFSFPLILQSSHICTSGAGGVGPCQGDSGGPLTTIRDGRPILIGITSFGSTAGCEAGNPTVYARVTSYLDFIAQWS